MLLAAAGCLPSATASNDFSPFYPPFLDDSYLLLGDHDQSLELVKRQTCPSGFSNCAAQGNGGACCSSGTTCTTDGGGRVACCPTNAACTGTINAGTGSGSLVTLTQGGTTSSSSLFLVPATASGSTSGSITASPTASSSTSGGLVFPTTTTAASIAGGFGGGSTVPNAPYPFVFIPTSYANAQACSSAFTQCQSQFTSCTASLGGANGVTVSGGGAGTTVAGATATGSASAICSSLSQTACYGLQLSNCQAYGTNGETVGASTSGGNSFVVTTRNAAPTRCPGNYYEIGVGFAVGAVGALA